MSVNMLFLPLQIAMRSSSSAVGGAIGTADPDVDGAGPALEETVCASGASALGIAESTGALVLVALAASADVASGALDPAGGAIAVDVAIEVAAGVASPDPVCAPLHAVSAIESTKREDRRVEDIR